MTIITDLLQSASNGIIPIFKSMIAFIPFVFFIVWGSINDLKTMKIKDYQNLSFFLVGLILFGSAMLGILDTGFTLGMGHVYGAIVGFLLLFIPGMFLNTAIGGDIKFVTVMGFWVGPAAIILILLFATFIQLLALSGKLIKTRSIDLQMKLPFAPAFTIAYFISLGIFL